MSYVLDANILIAGFNGHTSVLARLEALKPGEAILCAPVLAELRYGASLSSRRRQNLERLEQTTADMRLRPFNAAAARRFGDLKATLRRRGITISDFDLAIATITLELGAILVSDDHAFHDNPIEGLEVENWLASGG